jgi:uncharacterized protein YbaP (TraB family)
MTLSCTAARNFERGSLRCLALLVCLLCVSAARADDPPAVLWSIEGKTNTVYLLGSVHFLRPTDELPKKLHEAYADAERLLMEIDMDDLDPAEAQAATLELGLLPEGETLESHIGAADYAKVSAFARSLGFEPALLNRFRPWLAAITLTQLKLMRMGFNASAGIEQRFVALAAEDKKEISGLETLREQLEMLANLPAQSQREFLLYTVEDTQRISQEIDELVSAWHSGDTKRLAKVLAEGFDLYPDLYRPLTVERNRKWIAPIEALLDDEDDYLVIVGALHLVGDDSLIELLEKRGHRVVRH